MVVCARVATPFSDGHKSGSHKWDRMMHFPQCMNASRTETTRARLGTFPSSAMLSRSEVGLGFPRDKKNEADVRILEYIVESVGTLVTRSFRDGDSVFVQQLYEPSWIAFG